MTRGPRIEVCPVAPNELAETLALLEEFTREGVSAPSAFAEQIARAVEAGDLELLVARAGPEGPAVGVAVLAFRPNISVGAFFASVEDLYVSTDARGQGVGRALLGAVEEQCGARGISYVEVQTDEEAAPFYEASGYETEAGVRVLSRSYLL